MFKIFTHNNLCDLPDLNKDGLLPSLTKISCNLKCFGSTYSGDVLGGIIVSAGDSTKFISWNIKTTEFHLLTRIASLTIYPVGAFFGSTSPSIATSKALR